MTNELQTVDVQRFMDDRRRRVLADAHARLRRDIIATWPLRVASMCDDLRKMVSYQHYDEEAAAYLEQMIVGSFRETFGHDMVVPPENDDARED